ncbi:MAG: hypothetical protein MUO67_01490, partial [Anaerolineales bacterium]|nr:hypothetical protein [Anaerolineales bacterium]
MKHKNNRLWLILAVLLVAAMMLSACGGSTTEAEPTAAPTEEATTEEETTTDASDEDITIAFSGFAMTNEFWLTLERAAEARAAELGIEFINLTTEVQDAEA